MKILSLDISSKTGWVLLEGTPGPEALPKILLSGRKTLQDFGHEKVANAGQYPWSFITVSKLFASFVGYLHEEHKPDVVVIEDTSESRNRFAQKLLEFIHYAVLTQLMGQNVVYVQVGSWRAVLDLRMTAEDKKNNKLVSRAKKTGRSKAELGVKGKVTKKHLALRFVERHFGVKLKVKDNDIADAICLGTAYLRGARPSEGLYGNPDE